MEQPTLDALLQSFNNDPNINGLIQSSTICHKVFDPDLKLRFMGSCGVAALQIENIENYYGHTFPTDAAPKDTRDIFNEHMYRATKGETSTIEYSFEIDGNVIWYRTIISPVFDDDNLIYITANSMDITERIKADEEIKKLSTLPSENPNPVFRVSIDGVVLYANKKALSILKHLNCGIKKIMPPPFIEVIKKTVATQKHSIFEWKFERQIFEFNLVYIKETPHLNIYAYDISKLKKARKEAERANHAKSDFLARMSHELRTPMNAILGFTQLLEINPKSKLSDSEKENLQMISSAGKHLLKLINEVLDLSRIESKNLDLTIEAIDLVPIVDNVISISKSLANEKGLSIEYQEIPIDSYFVEVDQFRIKQVILNLISNAIKFNKSNGSIIVSYEKQDNNTIRLGIRDTGRGIPINMQKNLFKPFERLGIKSEQIEGTGIGLTITKQLIELMNGTIGFKSVVKEGSFFYVDIPLSVQNLLPTHINEKTESIQSPLRNDKKQILYIEDIPVNIELVKQILDHRQDIRLLSASTALNGIKLAQSEAPDLILMDIHMPGMDGLTAFEELQKIQGTKNIPVIALTADAMNNNIKNALDMGFINYITKPINVIEFLDVIDEVFKQK